MTAVIDNPGHVWTLPTLADLKESIRVDRVVASVLVVCATLLALGAIAGAVYLSANGKDYVVITTMLTALAGVGVRGIVAWRTKQPPSDDGSA